MTHTPSYNYAGGSVVSFRDWTYDAAGQMTQAKETVTANNSVSTYISNHDGDGQPTIEYYQENLATKSFTVRSSVLGGKVLTRLDNSGNKSSTVFDVDGLLTAVQSVSPYGSSVRWTHIDPLGLSEAGDTKSVFDPMGNYIVWQHAPTYPPPGAYPPIAASFGGLGPSFGYAINSACILDGIPTDCSLALNMLQHGSAEQCPNNYCGPERVRNPWTKQIELKPLTRDPDTGQLGYYPTKPQNSSERRLTKEEYLAIRGRMETALKSKTCRDFIDTLVTYAQGLQNPPGGPYDSAEDFLAFSDFIYNSPDGGMFWRPKGGGQVGHTYWISNGTRPDLNVRPDAGTLMHLLIHGLQGRMGSDDTLSVAVRDLGIRPVDKDGKPLPFPNGSIDHDWSKYWDTALQNACFPKDIR